MSKPLLQRLTGARPDEQGRVVACFFSLLFLLASYYLVKPLRNSQFLKEFLPTSLPMYYLLVSALSFSITKLFSYFYDRLNKGRLLTYTFLIMCGCKVAFIYLLTQGGKVVTVAFFLWASIYFLLALSAIWGCINEIFRAEQGERCFGFIATGSTLGNIAGSEISERVAAYGFYSLLLSVFFMLISLFFVLRARRGVDPPEASLSPAGSSSEGSVLHEIRLLMANPFLRNIGVMVLCLAVYSTGIDFISQGQMDRRLAERQYRLDFAALNRELNERAGLPPTGLNPEGFEFVYHLRQGHSDDLPQTLQRFCLDHQLKGVSPDQLSRSYQEFRQGLNTGTKEFFAQTYKRQGVCGIVVLTLVCPWLFSRVGIRWSALLMPSFSLLGLALFAFPLSLETIQLLLVLGGTLNYSLNNATKEVLYTVATTDEKYKIKPLIEGPCMRAGDVVASLTSLTLAFVVEQMHWPAVAKERLYLVFCTFCVAIWLRQIYRAGRLYERARQHAHEASPSSS